MLFRYRSKKNARTSMPLIREVEEDSSCDASEGRLPGDVGEAACGVLMRRHSSAGASSTFDCSSVRRQRIQLWISQVWDVCEGDDVMTADWRDAVDLDDDDEDDVTLSDVFAHEEARTCENDANNNDVTCLGESDRWGCLGECYCIPQSDPSAPSCVLFAYVAPDVTSSALNALAFLVHALRTHRARHRPSTHLPSPPAVVSPFKRHFASRVRQPIRRTRAHLPRLQTLFTNTDTCCHVNNNNNNSSSSISSRFRRKALTCKRNSSHVSSSETGDVTLQARRVRSWANGCRWQWESQRNVDAVSSVMLESDTNHRTKSNRKDKLRLLATLQVRECRLSLFSD